MKTSDEKDQNESMNRYRVPYRAGADLQHKNALRHLASDLLWQLSLYLHPCLNSTTESFPV